MLELTMSILIGTVVGYILLSIDSEDKTVNLKDRLNRINYQAEGISAEEDETSKEIDKLIRNTEYKIQALGEFLDKYNFFTVLKKQLKMAEIDLKPDIFILISVVPCTVLVALGIVIHKLPVLGAIGLMIAFFPSVLLKMRIKKRHTTFTSQFPDTLDLIASSLRAGHSLLAAFQMVAREVPDPVGSIFKTASDDISLGRDTRDALDNMTELMPNSMDLRFFITAVLIQREIGGNLAEILDSLNYTIRERFKLIGQISTQTAQAKLSGIILAIAPFALAGLISVLNPTYLRPLFTTLIGISAIGISITMSIIGYLIINKITDIRV